MEPLRFQPFLRPMVWGGRRLADVLGKSLPDAQMYGESWEVSDHPLHHSKVASGSYQGRTLHEVMERHAEELLGASATAHKIFPWLIKYLDCHDWLSVQVHPDESAVKTLWPGEGSKTEAWFILDAAPESRIYAGLRPEVNEGKLRQAIAQGTVADCLHSFTPRPGDCVFLPAGTVHAVGGGVLMVEVQQTSDATFRLFDWNRRDSQGQSRKLHVDEGMQAVHWDQGPIQPRNVSEKQGHLTGRGLNLVECPFFTLEFLAPTTPLTWKVNQLQAVLVVAGKGRLHSETRTESLQMGDVLILPASLSRVHFEPAGQMSLLITRLP